MKNTSQALYTEYKHLSYGRFNPDMCLCIYLKELERLLEDFCRVTQIRITVFDDQFQKIVSYPVNPPAFCRMIRSCGEGRSACAQSLSAETHRPQEVIATKGSACPWRFSCLHPQNRNDIMK